MIENKLIIRYIHFNQFELFEWLGGHLFNISPQDDQSPQKINFTKKIPFDHIDTIICPFHTNFPHHMKKLKN